MIRITKPLKKNSPGNLIRPLIFILLMGFTLPECSHTLALKKNISTTPTAIIQEKSIIPEQLKVLNFNAAITLTTPTSELQLFAAITYRSLDTLTIQLKDPLKRQLAKIEISNGEYQLWLQREAKYYSGLQWPDLTIDYEIPEIPIACLPAILIGLTPPTQNLTSAPAIIYQYTYNKLRLIKSLTALKEQQPLATIHYDNYHQLESGFWLPSLLKITSPQGLGISIQYSQFRYELIKLA
jgi:hypothetical protein